MSNTRIEAHSTSCQIQHQVQKIVFVSLAVISAIAAATVSLTILSRFGYPLGPFNTFPFINSFPSQTLYAVTTGASALCAFAIYSLCTMKSSAPSQNTAFKTSPENKTLHPVPKESDQKNDFSTLHEKYSPRASHLSQDTSESFSSAASVHSSLERSSTNDSDISISSEEIDLSYNKFLESVRLKIEHTQGGYFCKIDNLNGFVLIYCSEKKMNRMNFKEGKHKVFSNPFERDLFIEQEFSKPTDVSFILSEISDEENRNLSTQISEVRNNSKIKINARNFVIFNFANRFGVIAQGTGPIFGLYTNEKARDQYVGLLEDDGFIDCNSEELETFFSSIFLKRPLSDDKIRQLVAKLNLPRQFCLIDRLNDYIFAYWDHDNQKIQIEHFKSSYERFKRVYPLIGTYDKIISENKIVKVPINYSFFSINLSFIQFEVHQKDLVNDEVYLLFKESASLISKGRYFSYDHPQGKWYGVSFRSNVGTQYDTSVYYTEKARDEHIEFLESRGMNDWIKEWTRDLTCTETLSISLIPRKKCKPQDFENHFLPNDFYYLESKDSQYLGFISVVYEKEDINSLNDFINQEGDYCKIDYHQTKYGLVYFDKKNEQDVFRDFKTREEREIIIEKNALHTDFSSMQYLIHPNKKAELQKINIYGLCRSSISKCGNNQFLFFNFPSENSYGLVLKYTENKKTYISTYIFTQKKERDNYISHLKVMGYQDGFTKWSQFPYTEIETEYLLLSKSETFLNDFKRIPIPFTLYHYQVVEKGRELGWILRYLDSDNYYVDEGFKTRKQFKARYQELLQSKVEDDEHRPNRFQDGHRPEINKKIIDNYRSDFKQLDYYHQKFKSISKDDKHVYGLFPYYTDDPTKSSFCSLVLKHDSDYQFLYFTHLAGAKGYLREKCPNYKLFNYDRFMEEEIGSYDIRDVGLYKNWYSDLTKHHQDFKESTKNEKKVYGLFPCRTTNPKQSSLCSLVIKHDNNKYEYLYFIFVGTAREYIRKKHPNYNPFSSIEFRKRSVKK